eukprot:12903471-Prorocentrum_lima.AAC.1
MALSLPEGPSRGSTHRSLACTLSLVDLIPPPPSPSLTRSTLCTTSSACRTPGTLLWLGME